MQVEAGSHVLVTGASGYIGGRLVGRLLDAGYRVRCLARTPAKLRAATWWDRVEVVEGDVHADLTAAMDGIDAVYYLVHSIGDGDAWTEREAAAATNVRVAAEAAGVRRIVYLGGLGNADDSVARRLSPHLRSRHRVGEILAAGSVPVTELRAAVIIGSGSASFEMLRYLVEVLPIMVTPRWVDTRCQPIAVRDVLRHLVQVLTLEETQGRVLEIGGPDVLTYREMMAIYAEEAGLRPRVVLPVPVLTPRLSSLWVGVVTPLPRALARPLVDSLVNEVVVRERSILDDHGSCLTYRESVRRALRNIEKHDVATSWSGAGSDTSAAPLPTDPDWAGGAVLHDVRVRTVQASAADVYRVVCGVGGERGWYSGEKLWEFRGLLDKLVGGPGMRRGRRDPDLIRIGDTVDFWRVQDMDQNRLLRLRAEMRLPGVASIEWRLDEEPEDGLGPRCRLEQVATFVPRGLWGRVYWYAVAPFHSFVFRGLIDGLARRAEGGPIAGEPAGREPVASVVEPGHPSSRVGKSIAAQSPDRP